MRTLVKTLLDVVLHPVGLNVERFFGKELALKKLVKIAFENRIDLILDIGANTGQFASKMIDCGYRQRIISFEPLSSAYPHLLKNALKHENWEAAERAAIGDLDGMIHINVSINSHSSSILTVNQQHVDAAPSAAFIGKEEVPIKKLDSLMNEFDGSSAILLKIDTQGFEKNVIEGALHLIQTKVKIILLELSLLPLYEGAVTFADMVKYLETIGFEPLFYNPGYTDRSTDEIQQLEGCFIKREMVGTAGAARGI